MRELLSSRRANGDSRSMTDTYWGSASLMSSSTPTLRLSRNWSVPDRVIAAWGAHSGQQYNAGAKSFLFVNVPPVNRSPLVRS